MISSCISRFAGVRGQLSITRLLCTSTELPFHKHSIKMPTIDDSASSGCLEKWLVKVGDTIKVGDTLCHVSVGDLIVGVDSDYKGVLAVMNVDEGSENVPCGSDIAFCVNDKDEYLKYLENELRQAKKSDKNSNIDKKMENVVAPSPTTESVTKTEKAEEKDVAVPTEKVATIKDVLREIKYLINNGTIEEESEFAKKILSLARKGDPQLLIVFEAAFEDDVSSYSEHDKFDANFFLDNATCILQEAGHDVVNPTSGK